MQEPRPGAAWVPGAAADHADVAPADAGAKGLVARTSIGGALAAVEVIDADGAAHEYLCGLGPGRATQKLLTWTLQRWGATHAVVTVDVDLGRRLGTIEDGRIRIWVDVHAAL